MEIMDIEVPCVDTSEIKKALKEMSRGKAVGENGLSIDVIKDTGNFLQYKLTGLFYQMFRNLFHTNLLKKPNNNTNSHQKKYLKNKTHLPINLLSVVYKLFTKVFTNRNSAKLDSNSDAHTHKRKHAMVNKACIRSANQIYPPLLAWPMWTVDINHLRHTTQLFPRHCRAAWL